MVNVLKLYFDLLQRVTKSKRIHLCFNVFLMYFITVAMYFVNTVAGINCVSMYFDVFCHSVTVAVYFVDSTVVGGSVDTKVIFRRRDNARNYQQKLSNSQNYCPTLIFIICLAHIAKIWKYSHLRTIPDHKNLL